MARREKATVVFAATCTVLLGGGVSSCGRDQAASEVDARDAGGDTFVPSDVVLPSNDSSCQPFSDAGEPEVPARFDFDGGVPLDQLTFAVAVTECNYWGRCFSLAPYVVGDCIDALNKGGAWHLDTCEGSASRSLCLVQTIVPFFPDPALIHAVGAGPVRYDPDQGSACLRALQLQNCHGPSLWLDIPACAGLFSYLSDAGVDDAGPVDAAGDDADVNCSSLLAAAAAPLVPCSTGGDCADAPAPGGPYCVDGYCTAQSCGDYFGCPSFVEIGQPCDSDPPIFGATLATPWGGEPARICSPGLTCSGLTGGDGSLGICALPSDIDGSCVEAASITGCGRGLTCHCGACQLPPSQGPCASGACEVGIAYCDLKANTCRPVKQIGEDCAAAVQACASDLICGSANTCELASTYLGH